jgi:C-terminal peptidase prc
MRSMNEYTNSMTQTRLRGVLLAVLALVALACKPAAVPVAAHHAKPKAAGPATAAAPQPVDPASEEGTTTVAGAAGTKHAAAPKGDDDEEDEDSDNESDYWKGIQFDVHNFDEVLDYVSTYYIDATSDRKRAWVEAANFALLSLEPAVELLPDSFFKARHGIPDEEGRLDGTTAAFQCNSTALAGVVLHTLPSDDYLKAHRPVRKKGRLSNEEVLALREKYKTRAALYNDTWDKLSFDRPEFDCVMAYVTKEIKAYQVLHPAPPKMTKEQAKAAKIAAEKALQDKIKLAKGEKPGDKPAAAKDADMPDVPKLAPDLNRAWLAAAQGFLYALDPHSSVIARRAWDKSTQETQDNSFEGIGAVLTQRDDQTVIENPMEGRPAWKAGLRAGDIIHKVDGNDVTGLLLTKVVKQIRGKRNTIVTLTISRESDPEPKDYAITREHIDVKNVDGSLVKEYNGIATVKMNGFIPQSVTDLRDQIAKLEKAAPGGKLTGLILDLRNNSGGLLDKAIKIADMFLAKGRIVSVKSRRKAEEVHEASPSPSDYGYPLVVLVSDGSASASEIVASALQDNKRGLVVGLRTFGKASVQTLFEPALHQDYYIKLTIARYYAPSGYTLQVVGVTPDVEAAPDIDGKIPVGFREENLNNHLVPIQGTQVSPWADQIPALDKCVKETGKADAIAKREPKPQIHPDYQLLKAADYVACLGKLGATP